MNTLQDLGSPDAEAQALIAVMSRKEALIWAQNSIDHYSRVMGGTLVVSLEWATTKMRFWVDVKRLIKLETQSDEAAS